MEHDFGRFRKDRAEKILEQLADVDPGRMVETDDLATVMCYVLDHKPTAVYVARFETELNGGPVNYARLRDILSEYAR